MDSLSLFSHAPLPDSSTHIRLLEIQHGSFNQHVVCSLSTWALNAAPAYYAISYTWGDPALTANITIDGRRMVVRQNCEYVLQQAFNSKASRYFWVDALCIDQASTREKNHQVAMMGEIYKKAAHVLACVGAHGGDSEYMLEVLEKKNNMFLEIHANSQADKDFEGLWGVGFINDPTPSTRKLAQRCFFTMTMKARKRLVAAFLAFMQRPYFARVWVLQELHLASQVSYCCGKDVFPSDSMLALSLLVEIWLLHRVYLPRPVAIHLDGISFLGVVFDEDTRAAFYDVESQRGCLELASGTRSSWQLEDVLNAVHEFQCADLRDKVYGILSLAQWPEDKAPVPDYKQDIFELAIEVMSILLVRQVRRGLGCARSLIKLLRLSKESERVQQALQQRRVTPESTQQASKSQHCALFTTGGWWGAQLFYETPDDARLGSFRDTNNAPQSSERGFRKPSNGQRKLIIRSPRLRANLDGVELVDQGGAAFGFAPADTRDGDWYLSPAGHPTFNRWAYLGIIIRASNDQPHPYKLIGQVWQDRKLEWSQNYEARPFSIYWHPEDLLILGLLYETRPKEDSSTEPIEEWVSTCICNMPNSSYAVKMSKEYEPVEGADI